MALLLRSGDESIDDIVPFAIELPVGRFVQPPKIDRVTQLVTQVTPHLCGGLDRRFQTPGGFTQV